jgi:hypothetical protein
MLRLLLDLSAGFELATGLVQEGGQGLQLTPPTAKRGGRRDIQAAGRATPGSGAGSTRRVSTVMLEDRSCPSSVQVSG